MKIIHTNSIDVAKASIESIAGEDYIVVPVVALKEGVLNGVYYPKKEIENHSNTWNGVPVPVNHPREGNTNVSANSPKFEESTNIGKFFNVTYIDGTLKGEIWLNVSKADRLGYRNILDHFNDGKMMEVSTGLYSEIEDKEGIYNNVPYKYIAKNIHPDHLALLPDQKGACSIADGCGALRNNKCNECKECKNFLVEKLKDRENNNSINAVEKKERTLMGKKENVEVLQTNTTTEPQEEKQLPPEAKINKIEKKLVNKEKSSEPVKNILTDEQMIFFNELKKREEVRIKELTDSVVKAFPKLSFKIVSNMETSAIEALAASIEPKADFSAKIGSNTEKISTRSHIPVLLRNKENNNA